MSAGSRSASVNFAATSCEDDRGPMTAAEQYALIVTASAFFRMLGTRYLTLNHPTQERIT